MRAYGATAKEAAAMTEALALRVLAEPLEHGEAKPIAVNIALAPIQPLAGGESQSRARRT